MNFKILKSFELPQNGGRTEIFMKYDIKVGFSRVNVNPPLGTLIGGYVEWRRTEGILDDVEINSVAFEKDGKIALISVIDNLHLRSHFVDKLVQAISKKTGISEDSIFLHATHTHVSPYTEIKEGISSEIDHQYLDFLFLRFIDAAVYAIDDLTDARMGYKETTVKEHAFNRRYLMKDGTTETNPGVNNPNIEKSIGVVDDRVNVVRFERADGENIVLINYGNHPDVIGGNKISADWPGHARRIFEKAIDNTRAIVLNGAQGDLNHIKTNPAPGEMVDMFIDFDNVPRGYGYSKHLGNVLAAAAMQVYETVNFTECSDLKFKKETISVPTNMPKPEEIPDARYIDEMEKAGRSAELPYKGMLLTTYIAGARRILELEHGPETRDMVLSAISVGNIIFVGIPGEPFCGIGIGIKEAKGWDMVLPCCLVNGDLGYFPMQDSYDEGGYEARSSRFKAGVAELLIEEGKKLADSLR